MQAKRIRHIIFIVLLGLITPKLYAQFNTDRLTAIGRNALYFDDYVVSMQYFNQVIKLKPYLYEPYLLRAIAKIQLSDWQGALSDLNTTILRNPFQPGAFYTRGYVYRQLGDWQAAENDFTEALRFSPDNRTYLLMRADVRCQQQNYALALEDIDYLLRREPDAPSLLFEKGVICIQQQDTACAVEHFTRTTILDSHNPTNWSALGCVEMMQGHDSAALADLTRSINLGSKYAGDFANRGLLRYRRHDYRGALTDMDRSVELAPSDAQSLYNRGILRAELGDKNRALDDLNRAIDLEPERTEMRYQRAILLLDLGQWSSALNDLDALREVYPSFLPAYFLAAQAHTALGHSKIAFDLRQQASHIEKNHDSLTPDTALQASLSPISTQQTKRNYRKEFSTRAAENKEEVITEDKAYESDTRGSIQHKQVAVVNEPNISLSYYRQPASIRQTHYSHYTIDEYNIYHPHIYLSLNDLPLTAELVNYHFEQINRLSSRIEHINDLEPRQQSSLYFARAMHFALVQDYLSAIDDCTQAIIRDPSHVFMYFARANWRFRQIEYQRLSGDAKVEMDFEIMFREYDYVTKIQPDFAFAYYNKANILCLQREWDAAIHCYSQAIEADADFAEAYFNRGLTYIYTDRIEEGIQDLSKAGELGIYQAYNLISRFQ